MKVAIAGGGISGLACAYYLQRAGIDATVFDPAPGGLIGTTTVEGCVLETGPESWLAAKPEAEALIREIGLGEQIMESNEARRRTYVLRHGSFETLPEGLQLVVPTKIRPVLETRLFSWSTKFRMGLEVLRSPKLMADRSVTAFINDHFGTEAVDYLAEPLLAGVYGGSPDELSAASVLPKFVEYEQRFGSVVVGALRDRKPAPRSGGARPGIFKTMRHGMGTVIDNLRARVNIVTAPVEALAPGDTAQELWRIYVAGEWQGFDSIVLACGANHAAPLVAPVEERTGQLLGSIPHTGSAVWTMAYRREDVPHALDAFGFLVPRGERGAIMACTWVNTKWEGRIPDDKAVLRCFSTNVEVTREEVERDLARLMNVTAEPLFALPYRWPGSMPQYTVGHTARIAELDARVARIPGLHLAGNAYHGVGIPDCIRSARAAATAIARAAVSAQAGANV